MINYSKRLFIRLLVEEDGPTAVEYAVMLAAIIVGCLGAILSTGNVQKLMFQDTADAMSQNMGN